MKKKKKAAASRSKASPAKRSVGSSSSSIGKYIIGSSTKARPPRSSPKVPKRGTHSRRSEAPPDAHMRESQLLIGVR